MNYLLSLDASSQGCSVALFGKESLIAYTEIRQEKASAAYFTSLIQQVLHNAQVDFSDISAVAVAKGPGSYTGLRVAVSTAKGLCFGLGIPLISYGTLEAMALQIEPKLAEDHLLCPMIDARRMEVFCAFYDGTERGVLGEISAEIIDETSFLPLLEKRKVLFFGEGSAKCKAIIKHPHALFLEMPVLPDARFSKEIIFKKFLNQDFEDLVRFEPFYLKEYMFKTKQP
jgi:tRNA threonylcarbamoyladenosine biosynthesis protein TsaB